MTRYASLNTREQEAQFDDMAVDAFARKMKAKLDLSRASGRYGWSNMDPDVLVEELRHEILKGDVVDIANYCMFLSWLGKANISNA